MGKEDMGKARLTYNPFIQIVETYKTSNTLKLTSDIFKYPEEYEGVDAEDTRNIIKEFTHTQWASGKTELDTYPNSSAPDIFSPLLEKNISQLYIFDLNHFLS